MRTKKKNIKNKRKTYKKKIDKRKRKRKRKTITKGQIPLFWDQAMLNPATRPATEYHIRLRWRRNDKEYSKETA